MTCAICSAALKGELLTAEAIEMYNAGKMGMRDVSMTNVSDVVVAGGEEFTLRSLGNLIGRALGFAKKEEAPLKSVKIAQDKRRSRLFADVDLEQTSSLGSMVDVDAALNRAKEKER